MAGLAVVIVASFLPVAGPARAANQWVTIIGLNFVPRDIIIDVGDTVTWQNNETSALHTATSTFAPPGGAFDSGNIAAGGGIYTHTFSIAGTYTYRCNIHPSMTGSITVNAEIPEFSGFSFVAVGLLALMLGLLLIRRET